jgi:hypothetical protein
VSKAGERLAEILRGTTKANAPASLAEARQLAPELDADGRRQLAALEAYVASEGIAVPPPPEDGRRFLWTEDDFERGGVFFHHGPTDAEIAAADAE